MYNIPTFAAPAKPLSQRPRTPVRESRGPPVENEESQPRNRQNETLQSPNSFSRNDICNEKKKAPPCFLDNHITLSQRLWLELLAALND